MRRIALIGDYNRNVMAHQAIPKAVEIASNTIGELVKPEWLGTLELARMTEADLEGYHAFWCTPGSPYQNMDGALFAIRFARETGRPFLGTCGGFQHALIEYARNVLAYQEADHAESNPQAAMPLVRALRCSLVEQQGQICLQPGSKISQICQTDSITGTYHCNYGLNPQYQSILEQGGVLFSGVDSNQDARIFELPSHPFYFGTLFQPERSALKNENHPLIQAFVRAFCNEPT